MHPGAVRRCLHDQRRKTLNRVEELPADRVLPCDTRLMLGHGGWAASEDGIERNEAEQEKRL